MALHKNYRLLESGAAAAAATALICTGYCVPAYSMSSVPDQPAADPSEANDGGLDIIVVTAQKRSESISDVGMSINALSGDKLKAHGVSSIDQFAKIDSSFTFGLSQSGTPTYTIRGVGYYDFALAAPPTVSAYVDQVPLAYSALTKSVTLDLERVEILKGPQGTLFGQNSTGGAINFIAAKPTRSFEAGLETTIERFGAVNVNGFVSGPLSDTLRARFAFSVDEGGAWQKSYTRPDDTLGNKRFQTARLLLDWHPADTVSVSVNLNGWRDRSDTQAGQLTGFPKPTALTNPASNVPPAVQSAILDYPIAPQDPRAADWGPFPPRAHEDFYQPSVRIDYELAPQVTLTSISAYSHFTTESVFDIDGMSLDNNTTRLGGSSRSVSQELRIGGKAVDSRLDWVLGGNYSSDKTTDIQFVYLPDSAPSYAFIGAGGPHWNFIKNQSKSDVKTSAAFANASFKFTDTLSAHAGARYTDSRTAYNGCTFDTGDGLWAAGINALQFVAKNFILPNPTPFVPVLPGGCATLDATFTPGPVVNSLNENNVSWRVGIDWKPTADSLLYTTVSKGYKAGAFPTSAFLSAVATAPVVQESVLASEVGFKTFWLDHRLQLDGAYFHYDYKNKQINGAVPEPVVFGSLFGLINIPKSALDGVELSAQWRPLHGLTLRSDTTWLRTRVIGNFVNVNRVGSSENFRDEAFPYTPQWSTLAGATYEWTASSSFSAYVGADYTYRTSTSNGFGNLPFERIRGYGLLDLRAGLRSVNDTWAVEFWGRNVTNTYYWNDATYVTDTSYRRTGKPVTYGITLGYRFR